MSCTASNHFIYRVPSEHFAVAFGTPSDEYGHFHMYVEVKVEAAQDFEEAEDDQEREFWIESRSSEDVSPEKIRQNFIRPHGTFYLEQKVNMYKVNMWLPHRFRNSFSSIHIPKIDLLTDEDPY